MRLLLDTSALIWFTTDSPRMPEHLKDLLEADGTETFVSFVSPWEIAIKTRLGKLDIGRPLHPDLAKLIARNGFTMLAPDWEEVQAVMELPFYHRDPFDRMLIAQALRRRLTVLTPDSVWELYGVSRLWN